jgi:hypothetical protein
MSGLLRGLPAVCALGIAALCGLVVIGPVAPAYAATACTATLCVLDGTAKDALNVHPGTLRVTGSILINSTDSEAAKVSGPVTATGTIGGPAAPAGFTTTGGGTYSPTPTNQPAGTDPFATLAQCPAATACPATPMLPFPSVNVAGTTQTINPGVFASITVSSGGQLTLNPGTYVVTTAFSASGTTTRVTGTGVTIYLACAAYPLPCLIPGAGAAYDAQAASVTLSAPTSGSYAGLAMFADRKNTADISIRANAFSTLGAVYAAKGRLLVSGSSASLTRAVVGTVDESGQNSLLLIGLPTGGLSITVPTPVALGATAPGSTLSVHIGSVTVSDQRGLANASWTATVSATDLITGAGTTAETIAKSLESYWSGPATSTTGVGTFTPGQVNAANAQPLSTPRTAFTLTAGTGSNSANWNPTLVVQVPAQAVKGTYAATLTHSVA